MSTELFCFGSAVATPIGVLYLRVHLRRWTSVALGCVRLYLTHQCRCYLACILESSVVLFVLMVHAVVAEKGFTGDR